MIFLRSLGVPGLSAVLMSVQVAYADQCALGSEEIAGNWYCQAVKAIQYSNVGSAGTYQQVAHMGADGSCNFQPKSYSGSIAPLDEEISMHFRGPIDIKQFAAYTPKSAAGKRNVHSRKLPGHIHRHVHGKRKELEKDVVNIEKKDMVIATINGEVVSWANNYFGSSVADTTTWTTTVLTTTKTAVLASANAQWIYATLDGKLVSWPASSAQAPTAAVPTPSTAAKPAQAAAIGVAEVQPVAPVKAASTSTAVATAANKGASATPPSSPSFPSSDTFDRIAYYDSASQTADNVAFLANHGGAGSGVFDSKFGASLSYVDSSGIVGSVSPQILADVTIPSGSEVAIFLNQPCANGDCGYTRPGSVGYHGFAGGDKVFLVELRMPDDGKLAVNDEIVNQPAFWALNAEVPRTQQYGNCSCWQSGCGEMDFIEALNSGSKLLKSTFHSNTPGGDSDYIVRPTVNTMKVAVVFSSVSATINIQVLPDDTTFTETMAASVINQMCIATKENPVSHFAITD